MSETRVDRLLTDPGWVVTPKEAPAELAEDFRPEPFTPEQVAAEYTALSEQRPEEPTSLRTDTDEWLAVMHRLSDEDRAALSTVVGIANAILDNE